MTRTPGPDEDETRFRECYRLHADAVLAYAVRRTEQPADAADVVAETFLVAWRRTREVPDGSDARPWLFGVARRVLANQRRSGRRRRQLGQRLREGLAAAAASPDHADAVASRSLVIAAMRQLGDLDQEVLALSAWEGLAPREIATVLDIEPDAARARLSRARRRMRALLGHDGEPAGHVQGVGPPAHAQPGRGSA